MSRSLFWFPFWPFADIRRPHSSRAVESDFEFGRPMFHYFTMRDYGASDQSWVALQDKQGRMLFGNRDCVLVYDGYVWQKIAIPGGVFIRALVMDQAGTIWVGGVDCLGQLVLKGNAYEFKSMTQLLPGFGEIIWRLLGRRCPREQNLYFDQQGAFDGARRCYHPDRLAIGHWIFLAALCQFRQSFRSRIADSLCMRSLTIALSRQSMPSF